MSGDRRTQARATQPRPAARRLGGLQRKCACGNHTLLGSECTECARKRVGLQRKLTIGASNDSLEHEADRVADQVLSVPTHAAADRVVPRIQRQAEQASDEGIAPPSVDLALAGGGIPLDDGLQREMARRFGHDFSHVRVHTGTLAEQSARDVHAQAYTVGNDIVFDAGQFAPGSPEGRKLIAHELTHVVQQGAAPPTQTAAPTNGRLALQPGAYALRLLLPDGEKWVGPPVLQGGHLFPAGPGPAGESPPEAGADRPAESNMPAQPSPDRARRIKRRLQRRANFTNPAPVAEDPLARLIAGGTPGLTTPTINGNVVASSADVLTQITPTAVTGSTSGGTTTCQFNAAFNINTSANVIVASNAGARGWTCSIPLSLLGRPAACAGAPASIPGVMVATPSNADFVTRVRNSEQEHVDAIRELHNRHFVPYDASVTGLRGTGATLPDCATNLMAKLGTRATQAGLGFVFGYAAETQRLDGPGGTHEDAATPTFGGGCRSVTLTVSQATAPIPGASRGNVVAVAPTVTRYDHMHLSVAGNNVVETNPATGGTVRVVHSFSSAANARAGLHVLVHYGTTSKNVIGNMTYLLLDGNVAPAGRGATLAGVTEESVDPARFQVTLGVPGANDWAISQIDGNNIRIIVNFGAQRNEAFSGADVLRRLGVTKFAFIGSRNSPELTFFRL